ncbi:alpha/beta hydrolase [Lachnotalea glycerini]|nr:alpha/beta hydrolase [Lachnotalea glycerini]
MEPLHVNVAKELLKKGIASVRFDFNGHGESEGIFEDMTVMNEIEDGREILRYAKSLPFAENISILGHSQGGVVAGMLAGYYPHEFTCLVQMAPAATLKDDAIKGTLMGTEYDPSNIPEYIQFWDKRLSSLYFRIAQKLPIYEVSAQFQGPVCLIHGTKDPIVSYTASQRYYDEYADSKLHLMDGQDHGFTNALDEATAIAVNFILEKVK